MLFNTPTIRTPGRQGSHSRGGVTQYTLGIAREPRERSNRRRAVARLFRGCMALGLVLILCFPSF